MPSEGETHLVSTESVVVDPVQGRAARGAVGSANKFYDRLISAQITLIQIECEHTPPAHLNCHGRVSLS